MTPPSRRTNVTGTTPVWPSGAAAPDAGAVAQEPAGGAGNHDAFGVGTDPQAAKAAATTMRRRTESRPGPPRTPLLIQAEGLDEGFLGHFYPSDVLHPLLALLLLLQ